MTNQITALEANLSPLTIQDTSNVEIDPLNSLINGQINCIKKSLNTITALIPTVKPEQMPILQSLIATLSDQYEILTKSLALRQNRLSVGSHMSVEGQLPELDEVEKFCFYTSNFDEKTSKEVRSAVICIHPFYFAKYADTTLVEYKENVTKVEVYKDSKEFNTTAVFVSNEQDFVILKSEEKICNFGPEICEKMCCGSIYLCGGFTNEIDKLKPCRKNGCLQSSKTERIKSGGELRGPYLIADVTASDVDSGSAVFCTHGLKGICIGALELPECSSKDVSGESAACLSKCAVIAAIDIMRMVDLLEREARGDPQPTFSFGDD
ncbi:unnamed protein product [Meloidogyne enterolobii]|uniref:Uncharacterized protein n=2 Tax=Meloidogyne enterolobii TaxID=390850 RepID=A0ACB0ZP22_MELEN